jgi:hypothetical protein
VHPDLALAFTIAAVTLDVAAIAGWLRFELCRRRRRSR